MAIKLFATDVDGTLLNNSRQISEGNKAKIRQAVKDGMIFTIATGRMHHSATPFVDDLGFALECADGFFRKPGLRGNLCDWCMLC